MCLFFSHNNALFSKRSPLLNTELWLGCGPTQIIERDPSINYGTNCPFACMQANEMGYKNCCRLGGTANVRGPIDLSTLLDLTNRRYNTYTVPPNLYVLNFLHSPSTFSICTNTVYVEYISIQFFFKSWWLLVHNGDVPP